jgi:hypothetical protein
MFHWKIIILLIIIKILSLILSQYYTNKHVNKILTDKDYIHADSEEETNICITPEIKDFLMCWVKYTVEMVNYSRAILSKNLEHNKYYDDLEKTKDNLVNLFSKIHNENVEEFKKLINEQISLKIDLCNAILYNDETEINNYSESLVKNTDDLSDFFNQLKHNRDIKDNNNKLKNTMNAHTSKYIKSMHFINKAGNDEITRELVLGSLDTAKLLF